MDDDHSKKHWRNAESLQSKQQMWQMKEPLLEPKLWKWTPFEFGLTEGKISSERDSESKLKPSYCIHIYLLHFGVFYLFFMKQTQWIGKLPWRKWHTHLFWTFTSGPTWIFPEAHYAGSVSVSFLFKIQKHHKKWLCSLVSMSNHHVTMVALLIILCHNAHRQTELRTQWEYWNLLAYFL